MEASVPSVPRPVSGSDILTSLSLAARVSRLGSEPGDRAQFLDPSTRAQENIFQCWGLLLTERAAQVSKRDFVVGYVAF